MERTCSDCLKSYDDAVRSTICPHDPFISTEDMKRKDLGLSLLGQLVRFRHWELNHPPLRVVSVGWDGMITLSGMGGEFTPELFIPADLKN